MSIESMMPSSLVPFSSCPQSLPESGTFPMSQFFAAIDHRIGASASASVLPMNIQGRFPLGLTSLIFQSKGLSRVFSNTTVQRHQFFSTQPTHALPTLKGEKTIHVGKSLGAILGFCLSHFLLFFFFNFLFCFPSLRLD